MAVFDSIVKPTILLDETTAKRNIARMTAKARAAGVAFRPHFKTHQSHAIGAWFRQEGVRAITVSSLDMAEYFAADGWDDITLAFSANIRQIPAMNALAEHIRLGLLVESVETAAALGAGIDAPVDIWLKIDGGAGRTGISWENPEAAARIAAEVMRHGQLHLKGLLTHAGNTYTAPNPDAAAAAFLQSVERIQSMRTALQSAGIPPHLISVGDTPGCSALTTFEGVDEIRPGNFVFYDAQQLRVGSCVFEDIAVALACPVVALHTERSEAVVYGGAIHLTKDTFEWQGSRAYGLVCLPAGHGWSAPLTDAAVTRLSQEHGILSLRPKDLARLHVGDLLCLIPAHSCLTVQAVGSYLTLDGARIDMMRV